MICLPNASSVLLPPYPGQVLRVNRSHPLCPDMFFIGNIGGGKWIDSVRGVQLAPRANAKWVSRGGYVTGADVGFNTTISPDLKTVLGATTPRITFVWKSTATAASNTDFGQVIGTTIDSAGGTAPYVSIIFYDGIGGEWSLGNSSGGTWSNAVSTGMTWLNGETHTFAWHNDNGSGVWQGYKDGVGKTTGTQLANLTTNASGLLSIGEPWSASRNPKSIVEYVAIFYRNLTPTQIREFGANPYACLQVDPWWLGPQIAGGAQVPYQPWYGRAPFFAQ